MPESTNESAPQSKHPPSYTLRFTRKQLDRVTSALCEWAIVERATRTNPRFAEELDTIRQDIYRQTDEQDARKRNGGVYAREHQTLKGEE